MCFSPLLSAAVSITSSVPNAMPLTHRQKLAALAASLAGLAVTLDDDEKSKARSQPSLARPALIPCRGMTPWKQLLSCGAPSDFTFTLSFPKELIVARILPLFESTRLRVNYGSPYRKGPKIRGRNPNIEPIDLLALVLWFLKSRCAAREMCFLFGIVPSSVSTWLNYSLEALWRLVKDHCSKGFEIRWPSPKEMELSAALLEKNRAHGGVLKGVLAVTGGGRMPCADYTDTGLQSAYYEGYTTSAEVTNLFALNFFGEIARAAVNYPGSWHDTRLAGASGLYANLLSDEKTPPGFAILWDSAFANDVRVTKGKVARGRKTNETSDIPEPVALAAVGLVLQKAMPSERQSAEWGIRALKGPFKRLTAPLPACSRKRLKIIQTCCHLLSFRARFVGLNQTRATYADEGSVIQP
eukprot:Plantae.Rhodophyta-Hildenbrandia_rubra.ctg7260.p1 GENE.Plantae.Rhodophyta-Hildenbrandia_rubra.ctg7260~~Plantae.Rhodophyta-Hildenbrandia_rubra.ctg7260.p1  ORF type:complete len:412 (+),score=29.57 Plantae.Rhodophyta-Hildenbrandia_rubra.ctg7260:277-1512(+)